MIERQKVIVDTDFMNYMTRGKDGLEYYFDKIVDDLKLEPVVHEFLYEKEMMGNPLVSKLVREKRLTVIKYQDFLTDLDDTYYSNLFSDLYKFCNDRPLNFGKANFRTYQESEANLGEIHSVILAFNIEWNKDIPKTLVRRDSYIRDNKSPSPELTIGGSWAKCLIREQKNSILGPIFGEIKLYKVSCKKDLKDIESEAVASKILNGLNIQNVNYSLEELIDIPCSVCKLQTTDNKHWVSAGDLLEYSECGNLVDLGLKYGGDRFIEMLLFDYIIGNNNRRSDNWSFEYNNENEIIGMAPLYDFNESFQDEYKEYDVLNTGRRQEEVLMELMRRYNMDGFPEQVKEVICDIEISEKHKNYYLSRIEMLIRKYNGI